MPRKTKKIAVRDEFLILTNGKRTEKNYFEAVRSNYKSIFKISVKFMYYGYRESPGMLQNVRCILEGLSMKRMFQAGDISEEKVNLLQVQEFLIEYRYYSRFTDILNLILIPEKLRKDYDDACVLFRSKLETKYNDKEIKNILRSNIPFLCNPAISHRFLIQKYLGSEYAMVYGLCSQIIHPSENNSYKNSECSHFVMLAYVLILNEYSHLPMTKTSLKSHTLMSMSSAIARELYQIIGDETKILEGIAEVFSQFFEDNYVSNTLRTISLLGQEMMFDRLTGFSEQVKVKWKLMMELFSVFHYEYVIQGLCEERYHLLIEHQNIQTLRNCNQHYDLAHAYEIYKRLYPHGCEMTTLSIYRMLKTKRMSAGTGSIILSDMNMMKPSKTISVLLRSEKMS